MEPIRVRLEDVGPEGVVLALDLEPDSLDLLDSTDVRFPGNMKARATIVKAGKKLRVSLSLDFVLLLPCSRCLAETEHRFSESSDFVFMPAPATLFPEQRLEEDDFTTQFFSGEEIDLAPLLREMVILAIPIKPLCKPDCKGLCPVCGADRNRETCEHTQENEPLDPRWEGLRGLRGKGSK